ncbi:ribbon-helix-helix domain-containing protein [Halobaculum sp. MBLA0147]|uniref:ribbon-helix-helix domain-containing protein n=1 Tax=Halobaculum sp. MBLA0147 TaxID=3079934 RepID=UPI003524BC92
MTKISVEIPGELLEDLDEHVGEDGKFVNRSDAVRASIRKTLDVLDEIDARHGRLEDRKTTTTTHAATDARDRVAGRDDDTTETAEHEPAGEGDGDA